MKPELALIIGCSRSGTTITRTVLNYHRQIHIAWETEYSLSFWRHLDNRSKYFKHLIETADQQIKTQAKLGGYVYDNNQIPLSKQKDLLVVGEKIWNPSMLLLAGQYNRIAELELVLQTSVKIINCIRHPQDVVATMCLRNKIQDETGINDRLNWLEQHLLATDSIKNRVDGNQLYDCYHEELILNPKQTIFAMIEFLGLEPSQINLDLVKSILFDQPKVTRNSINWSDRSWQRILDMQQKYSWLSKYNLD